MRSEKEARGEREKDKKRLYYDEKRIWAAFRTVLTPKQLQGLAKKTMHFGKQNDVKQIPAKTKVGKSGTLWEISRNVVGKNCDENKCQKLIMRRWSHIELFLYSQLSMAGKY